MKETTAEELHSKLGELQDVYVQADEKFYLLDYMTRNGIASGQFCIGLIGILDDYVVDADTMLTWFEEYEPSYSDPMDHFEVDQAPEPTEPEPAEPAPHDRYNLYADEYNMLIEYIELQKDLDIMAWDHLPEPSEALDAFNRLSDENNERILKIVRLRLKLDCDKADQEDSEGIAYWYGDENLADYIGITYPYIYFKRLLQTYVPRHLSDTDLYCLFSELYEGTGIIDRIIEDKYKDHADDDLHL